MNRRSFLATAAAASSATAFARRTPAQDQAAADAGPPLDDLTFRFGLVTYLWGKDWDLPALLKNCRAAGCEGVELRTTHKHGVEPSLNPAQRAETRAIIEASGVTCVGIGSDERFDNPDPAVVKKAIAAAKEFIVLSHDIGGTGVKVKPDRFHESVPREKTIEQIGKSLLELGEFAAGFGQEVRLEVHGQCSELPTIRKIIDVADHPQVRVCWNSNPSDLNGDGLEANFKLVSGRFGNTLHVRQLDDAKYPFAKLIELLVGIEYPGYVLLEAAPAVADPLPAITAQRQLFDRLAAAALKRASGAK